MESSPALATATDTSFANLRMILRALLAALGGWRMEAVVAVEVYRRVSRSIGKIERLLVRFRAGKLWRMPKRDAAPARPVRGAGVGPRLPRRFGWLMKLGGCQAAGFGAQLQTVLSTPELAELLVASPQAGRILRPWCRALAVELPGMADKAPAERGAVRRRRAPRAKPEPFRIPFPRGVLSVARRQGFGKAC